MAFIKQKSLDECKLQCGIRTRPLSSPHGVTQSLVLCVYFVCPFVLFLLVIVLSVLLQFTDSDYLFQTLLPTSSM
jgi:hypothetical protein